MLLRIAFPVLLHVSNLLLVGSHTSVASDTRMSNVRSSEIEIGPSTMSIQVSHGSNHAFSGSVMRREVQPAGGEDTSYPSGHVPLHPIDNEANKENDYPEGYDPSIPPPCSNVPCTPNKAKRYGAQLPKTCKKGTICDEDECCLGLCIDMPGDTSCPPGAAPKPYPLQPLACNSTECTLTECCVGYCEEAVCSAQSVIRNETDRPSHCHGYPCTEAECCIATCQGYTCPTGSQEKSSHLKPALCKDFPCEPLECCHPACERQLCDDKGAAFQGAYYKVLRNATNFFTGNLTVADHCATVPCTAEECCMGTCHESVCSHTHPPLPEPEWPSQCKEFECEIQECCEGRCSDRFCGHHGSALRDNVDENTTCLHDPCTPIECCAGKCQATVNGTATDRCPSLFGLLLKDSPPTHCNKLSCTTEECCDSVCTDAECPIEKGLTLNPTATGSRCPGPVCTERDCCEGGSAGP